VGRDAESDLPLRYSQVSRRHACFEPDGEGWLVRDLGSANGTFVGGVRVERVQLADGDVVDIGTVRLARRADPGARPIERAALLALRGYAGRRCCARSRRGRSCRYDKRAQLHLAGAEQKLDRGEPPAGSLDVSLAAIATAREVFPAYTGLAELEVRASLLAARYALATGRSARDALEKAEQGLGALREEKPKSVTLAAMTGLVATQEAEERMRAGAESPRRAREGAEGVPRGDNAVSAQARVCGGGGTGGTRCGTICGEAGGGDA